jgi:hypothetical protein
MATGGRVEPGARAERAGRLEAITELVQLQRLCSHINAHILRIRTNLAEHGVELSDTQAVRLSDARTSVLDCQDDLHSVAAELLGTIRRDPV